MQLKSQTADVGIIIGRFHVNNIHKSHRKLIEFVQSRHQRVIIFIGYSSIPCTYNNPLPYFSRKQMLENEFPNVNVLFVKDVASDELWSSSLDELIEDHIGNKTALLYGGRDSFIPYYTGKYPIQELMQDEYISGSDIRYSLGMNVLGSPDFRAGVIYATQNQYPQAIPTVDIVVFDKKTNSIVLVRKPNESKWRFPGGFVQPGETYEKAAVRELFEEVGKIEICNLSYIGSYVIDDWRYRKEVNKITTSFYKCNYLWGGIKGNDDVKEAKWFDVNELTINNVVNEHHILFKNLKEVF